MNTRMAWGILLAAFLPALFGCGGREQATTLTGLMDAVEIDVASKIPGRIKELHVDEGDRVEAGQALAEITSDEIAAKLEQVDAITEAAKAKLKMANKGAREEQIRAAKRQMMAAEHQVEITAKMKQRLANLLEKKAVPQAQYDEVEFKHNVSQEQYEMAKAQYEAYVNGARDEEIEALTALVRQAEGAKAEVESYQRETTQKAPVAGEISKVVLHEGELAATGFPILTIVDLENQWASFSVREDLLPGIHKGQRIQVTVPALDRTLELEIYHIAPMADFATWRATAERNSYDLKTFEVKARPTEPTTDLRPGMTVRWTLE